MPGTFGICGTIYKVKIEENLFWGEIWLPSPNARTRVRLLYSVPLIFENFSYLWSLYVYLKSLTYSSLDFGPGWLDKLHMQ